jgi:flagellar hook assembly protein FlgD
MNATDLVGEVGERTHKAKFAGDNNINAGENIDVKIAVSAGTPINNIQKSDGRTGIRLTSGNIVSDKAVFEVVLPNDKVLEVKVAIYDNTGNVVFEASGRDAKLSWNLTSASGRNVANGTYLIIAEAIGAKGTYAYSAKVGVKR